MRTLISGLAMRTFTEKTGIRLSAKDQRACSSPGGLVLFQKDLNFHETEFFFSTKKNSEKYDKFFDQETLKNLNFFFG